MANDSVEAGTVKGVLKGPWYFAALCSFSVPSGRALRAGQGFGSKLEAKAGPRGFIMQLTRQMERLHNEQLMALCGARGLALEDVECTLKTAAAHLTLGTACSGTDGPVVAWRCYISGRLSVAT